MLQNISFCNCCKLDVDEARESQCMFFGFTDRAKKVLSDDFLFQITEGEPFENADKSGISLTIEGEENGKRIFIKQVDENTYSIPARFIEPFVRCLFKYLPAFYIPHNDMKKDYCCTM